MEKSNASLVALISGGKDSIFNILECVKQGYNIQCVAYLQPKNYKEVQELDSFMFQSVGHNIVTQAYAECLAIPLIIHQTEGKSKFRQLEYFNRDNEEEDEVEDLYMLIKKVLDRFPNILGVTCGAIFSDYQRNRVENVCSRFGLISVAMLWRREQQELLDSMIENDIEAILIKTASMGLKPSVHCGKSIAQLRNYLIKLEEDYQVNSCGEGGEYESLVLDCPLFSKRIVVDETQIVVEDPHSIAPSGHLIVKKFHLEEKQTSEFLDLESRVLRLKSRAPILPQIFQQRTCSILDSSPYEEILTNHLKLKMQKVNHYVFMIGTYNAKINVPSNHQLNFLMKALQSEITNAGLELSDALQCHLYITNMSEFSALNQVYCQYFSDSPPSRVCVSLKKGLECEVMLTCMLADRTKSSRKVLHVQSVSPWAPACIGPYSQATLYENIIRMAGQIALDPSSMQLKTNGIQSETCIQNLQQVLTALRSDLSNCILCLIYVDTTQYKDDYRKLKGEFLSRLSSLHSIYSRSKEFDIKSIVHCIPVGTLPKSAQVEYVVTTCSDSVQDVASFFQEKDGISVHRTIVNNQNYFISLETTQDKLTKENLQKVLSSFPLNGLLSVHIFTQDHLLDSTNETVLPIIATRGKLEPDKIPFCNFTSEAEFVFVVLEGVLTC